MIWSTIIPIFAVLIVPGYVLWRKHEAVKARGSLAQEVDGYLGREDRPEELKLLVYRAFDDSQKHGLPFQIVYYFLFNSKNFDKKSGTALAEFCEKFGKENTREAIALVERLLVVNVRLSPVTYSLVGFLFVTASICRALANSTATSIQMRSLRHKIERSVLAAVH